MDVSKLLRDSTRVNQVLVKKDRKVLAKQPCRITIPEIYERKGLAELGLDNYIVAIYAINTGTHYANSIVPAMMRTQPSKISRVTIHNAPYIALDYEPGAAVIDQTELVRSESLIYNVFDTIIAGGRVPWNMNYDDMGRILKHAAQFAGSRIGNNHEVIELLVSMLARDPDNPNLEYRHTLKSFDQIDKRPPFFSPLRSVQFLATNTTSKLAGSLFSEGVVSALVNPSESTERIEELLRR